MKCAVVTAGGGVFFLIALSVVLPPLPLWVGVVAGITGFIIWGKLVARFIS